MVQRAVEVDAVPRDGPDDCQQRDDPACEYGCGPPAAAAALVGGVPVPVSEQQACHDRSCHVDGRGELGEEAERDHSGQLCEGQRRPPGCGRGEDEEEPRERHRLDGLDEVLVAHRDEQRRGRDEQRRDEGGAVTGEPARRGIDEREGRGLADEDGHEQSGLVLAE